MLKLKKIAITGGVASGKSSVGRFFQELGAFVVDADTIAHELLDPNTDLGQQIIRQFGPEVLEKTHDTVQNNLRFNRRILAEKVFSNPELLKKLEELLHPAVLLRINELYEHACKTGQATSFVVEIPLLYEIGAENNYDVVIAVFSEEKEAKARFKKAGFKPREYDQRMKRQIKPEQKAAKAHYTIHNKGSLEDLRKEVLKLNRIIQNR